MARYLKFKSANRQEEQNHWLETHAVKIEDAYSVGKHFHLDPEPKDDAVVLAEVSHRAHSITALTAVAIVENLRIYLDVTKAWTVKAWYLTEKENLKDDTYFTII